MKSPLESKIRSYSLIILILFSACVTTPKAPDSIAGLEHERLSPEDLYKVACQVGHNVHTAKGTVWFKIKSKEVTGQFSGHVVAEAPDQLRLEVVNGLGGTEALMIIDDKHYSITEGEKGKKTEGTGSWNGLPLAWAAGLFVGKIPCPPLSPTAQLVSAHEDELEIILPEANGAAEQKFKFKFEIDKKADRLFPESLTWERVSEPSTVVEFKFDDPEADSNSPQKWEAHSSEGAIKVRWRKRTVQLYAAPT